MAAKITKNNPLHYVTGALSTFCYTLTGSAVYDALPTPAGYEVLDILANFGYTAGDTALAGTENLVTVASTKKVHIYKIASLVPTGTYTINVVAFAKKVGGTT